MHSLTSAADGGESKLHALGRFTIRERTPSGNHWVCDWVGKRTGLDGVAKRKLPIPCRELNPDRWH